MAAPQDTKRASALAWQKRRAELLAQLGIVDAPDFMLQAIDAAMRTQTKQVDKEALENQYAFECSAEYHFARFTGPGATLAGPIYHVMFRIAKQSQNFHSSALRIAKYLNARPDSVYPAIGLLVAGGWLEVIETKDGAPTFYRPVGHEPWAKKTGGLYCCARWKNPFGHDDEHAAVGRQLHAILGGPRIFATMLAGWAKDTTDEELCDVAKRFMREDKGNERGTARRVRFSEYLKAYKLARPK